MASFFSKALRGAAQSGATLYADVARQELSASITAKRDGVLNANRMDLEKSRQEASTIQHQERMAQQE